MLMAATTTPSAVLPQSSPSISGSLGLVDDLLHPQPFYSSRCHTLNQISYPITKEYSTHRREDGDFVLGNIGIARKHKRIHGLPSYTQVMYERLSVYRDHVRRNRFGTWQIRVVV
jgi:hypothetical protein